VHTLMAKNKRQAYAVSEFAGMQVNKSCQLIPYRLPISHHIHQLLPSLRPPPNLGVPVVPSPVFLVCPVVVLPAPAREPSETCAEVVACSVRPRSGAVGTRRSA
jgi:hypothetical protein